MAAVVMSVLETSELSTLLDHVGDTLKEVMLTRVFKYSYEDTYEPEYMDDEPVAPDALGQEENENEDVEQATVNEDDLLPNGVEDINAPTTNGAHGSNVVVSGDSTATALAKKGITVGFKEKRIPKDKRSTTPYMTKYERARVLGTRALQIRSGFTILLI